MRIGMTVNWWRTAALVAALGGVPVLAGPPQPSPFSFYERFIAIDDVCAWPNINALPNGDMAVLIWPRNVHGIVEGAVECWVSRDHGRKWSKAAVPVPNEPGTRRMNVAAGVVDGVLVALVGGFGNSSPFEEDARFWSKEKIASMRGGRVGLPIIPALSRDSGMTWERQPAADLPPRPVAGGGTVPYGRIGKLPDGSWGAMTYGEGVTFIVSTDSGRTWQPRGVLAAHRSGTKFLADYNETTWLSLENGDLYAAARSFPLAEHLGGTILDGFRSTDGGRTWTREQALALPNQIPADLMRTPQGSLLLSYSSRNPGSRGIWLRFGSADARSWSAPILLVDLEGSTESQYPNAAPDGGYPSTVLAADGTYVTAYYSRGVPAHQRYHMGVVRWRLRSGPVTDYTR